MLRLDGAPYEPRYGDVLAAAPGVLEEMTSVCADFVKCTGWKPAPFR
jgi:hypothetical protein